MISPSTDFQLPALIGESAAMESLRRDIALVAGTDATVLIAGESGVGKQLVARALHEQSLRRYEPFVVFTAATLEAGAVADSFAATRGGTVLLDEIADATPSLQAKLIPFVPEQSLDGPGGDTVACPTRVIAATSRDLQAMVQLGGFRKDLYYRLNVFPLRVPPLRERKGDIPLLAAHFLGSASLSVGKTVRQFSGGAVSLLVNHPWPGNVRELRDCVERAVLVCDGDTIIPRHLPSSLLQPGAVTATSSLGGAVASLESELIRAELRSCGGNKSRAASNLGITISQIRLRVKRYGIDCDILRRPPRKAA
jgi:DNA-binding NtrC family response regulator